MRQADIEKIKFNNTNTNLSLSLHPCFPFRLNSIQFQQLPHEQLRKNTKFILRNPSPATHSHFQSTHLKIQNTKKSPQQLTITIKKITTNTQQTITHSFRKLINLLPRFVNSSKGLQHLLIVSLHLLHIFLHFRR